MDYTVTWSPEALDDVDAIAEYIARDPRFYARAVVDKIIEVFRKLNDFPKAGRVVPELGDDTILIHSKRLLEPVVIAGAE